MDSVINLFDEWDDWGDFGNLDHDSNSQGNQWGSGKDTHPENQWDFGGEIYPDNKKNDIETYGRNSQNNNGGYGNNKDQIYIVRGINENNLRGMGGFSKLYRGIPISSNNQINISLVESGKAVHGGGSLNGVIYGKIENYALAQGMKIRVQGKNKGGKFVINKMWDVDSGNMPIYINKYWRDPLDNGSGTGRNPVIIKTIVIVLAIIAALTLLMGNSVASHYIRVIFAIVALFIFMKIFNIHPLRNGTVKKILFVVVLLLASRFIPGGDELVVILITLAGIIMLLKVIH